MSCDPAILDATSQMATIPMYPQFTPISPKQQAEFCEAVKTLPVSSECSYLTWLGYRANHVGIATLNGNALLRWRSPDRRSVYITFLGLHEVAHTSLTLLENGNAWNELRLIPEAATALLHDGFSIVEDRDHFDYIHDAHALCVLSGGAYESKRQWANRFRRMHAPRVALLDLSAPIALRAVNEMAARWKRDKQSIGTAVASSLWGDELEAMQLALSNSELFDLVALGIWNAADELIAFSLAEIVTATRTAIVHFIKADTTRFPGSFECIMQSTATEVLRRGCNLINLGEDLGIPSLREAKRRYRPIKLLKKFTVRLARPAGDA